MAYERPDDHELDALLEQHFAGHLNGQLGRARRAFEEHHRRTASRARFVRIAAGVAGLAVAAVVALALVPRGTVPTPHPHSGPVASTAPDEPTGALEQVVWSRTTDLGTVLLEDQRPARKIVREQVREVTWTDAAGTRHIQAMKPQRDVLLISLDTY